MAENSTKRVMLRNLFLDPNNYRFIEQDQYVPVPEDKVTDQRIQMRTQNLVAGRKNENIDDLIESFRANGFLPVDQIQAKQIGTTNQYVIIEGNRRVTALKVLQKKYGEGEDIGALNPDVFKKVPVVLYDTQEEHHHQIVMGLKHISGNKKWPALNQAQFLWDLIHRYGMKEEEVISSLGITKIKLRRALKTLALIEEYKGSDYGDQFHSDMYSIFEEIIKSPGLRIWIEWVESKNRSTNPINRDRLFSWISDDEVIVNENDDGDIETKRLGRIITKSSEIRDLAKFITDEKALADLERTRSVTEAFAFSDRIKSYKVENALDAIDEHVNELLLYSRHVGEQSKEKVKFLMDKLTALAVTKGFQDILENDATSRNVLYNFKSNHYSQVTIQRFKKFYGLTINHLSRINLFAGMNNVGKSTLLEAVYLLTRQNDIYALFESYRRRGKFSAALHSVWFHQQPIHDFLIEGVYDQKNASVEIQKFEEGDESIEKSSYLSTVEVGSVFNGTRQESKARIYKDKENEVFFKNLSIICNSVFSSPFSSQNQEDILVFHERSIETKNYDRILEFLREKVDRDIQNIELAGELNRFLVTHDRFARALDLTQFGEGVQRIFHIALQFAAAENGILLIDELENAIHYSLLQDFILLVDELSRTFNVQVFVTSHSKECLDAFLKNNLNLNDVSGYRLYTQDDRVEVRYVPGERLAQLVEKFDLDLRG